MFSCPTCGKTYKTASGAQACYVSHFAPGNLTLSLTYLNPMRKEDTVRNGR